MKWITLVFIVLLILIITVANIGLGPSFFPIIYIVPWGDKLGHFILMGILSFLINSLLNAKKIRVNSCKFLIGTLIVLIFVTIEELSQIFIQSRAFSFCDLLFDYTGIIIFGQLSSFISKRLSIEEDIEKTFG